MSARGPYTVRRLAEAHRPTLMGFLRQDVINNQSLISHAANLGVSSGRITFWGAFDGPRLAGAAMRLDTAASVSTLEIDCVAGLAPCVSAAENLSGRLPVMEAVLALIPKDRLV